MTTDIEIRDVRAAIDNLASVIDARTVDPDDHDHLLCEIRDHLEGIKGEIARSATAAERIATVLETQLDLEKKR